MNVVVKTVCCSQDKLYRTAKKWPSLDVLCIDLCDWATW